MRVLRAVGCTLIVLCLVQSLVSIGARSEEAEADLNAHKEGTDAGAVDREAESMSHDGLSPAERKLVEDGAQKFEFQAEVSRLMDIIINSLYSKKEIFLRELISNASDACDKVRFLSLTDGKSAGDLDIHIEANKEAKTLSITDKGVGMTKNDLINHLGTIAKSGTSQFLEQMSKGGDMNLIGQFGVGFYSVYLVADRVTVTTKNDNDKQYIWESTADGAFSISEDPRGDTLGRGTRVTMLLKKDASEYLEESTLRNLIKKYSEFINFPIYLMTEKEVEVEVPDEDADKEEAKADDSADSDKKDEEEEKKDDEEEKKDEEDPDVKDVDEEGEKKPKTKKIKEKKNEWEQINKTKAIWLREQSEISDDEYSNFYQSISKDFQAPRSRIHFNAEGQIDFKSILFIPKTAPRDMFDKYTSKQENIKLYVRRVFISDEFDDLVPRWLSFVTGVVDSEDLPLNVSREQLQQNRILKVIKKKLISKAIEMIRKLADAEDRAVDKLEENADGKKDEEKKEDAEDKKEEDSEEEGGEEEEEEEDPEKTVKEYGEFLKEYAKSIKLGIVEDNKNRKKLIKMLRFSSTATKDDSTVSLQRYVDRMAEGQKHIYYISGDSKDSVKSSPYLEKLSKRGYEVLFMTDPMDEYMMQHVDEFEDKQFINVAKEDIKFGDKLEKREKKRAEKAKEDLKDFIDWYKELLKDRVEKVTVSNRLTDSPVAIVSGQYGYTAHMERLMKAQALADPSKYSFMAPKKTLEINPFHPLVVKLAQKMADDKDDQSAKDMAVTLFETAMVQGDFEIDNKADFTARVMAMMRKEMGVSADAVVEEPELPAEEEEPKEEDNKDDSEDGDEGEEEGEDNSKKDEL